MVITAAPSQSLAAELHRLLPDLRALVGPDRRCTVVFDRGGYSPQVFVEIIGAGFDLLTYFKGSWARAAVATFTTVDYLAPDAPATPTHSPNAPSPWLSRAGTRPPPRMRPWPAR